ncbi:unnamed protein product [Brachionus calyciflorus]|uniref:Uncharacterized protein n=1 Tax=Brachionus calyciflorus TaxID=104777 RepID=A0A813ZDN8_9BILA|nr:unnamed protein product [Brachionus calyciflorus]
MNEQFHENTKLNGFEIESRINGVVNISILELNGCQFIKLGYLTEDITSFEIQPFSIQKRMILVLNQTLSGKVQTVKSNFVSDYIINNDGNVNNAGNGLIKFRIKPMTNSTNKSELFFNFDKGYKSPGVNNIMVMIGNDSTSLELNITNIENLDLVCNFLKGSEYKCSVIIYTSTFNALAQLNNQNFQLIPRLVNFLGFDFPKEISNIEIKRDGFLLTSSEFVFDSILTGFEIYAIEAGKIQCDLIEFSLCSTNLSCASQFKNNFRLNLPIPTKTWVFDLKTGLNNIDFNFYYSITKGIVLRLVELDAKVGIDNSTNILSDLMLIQINSILDRFFDQNFFFDQSSIENNKNFNLIVASLVNSSLTKKINLSYVNR